MNRKSLFITVAGLLVLAFIGAGLLYKNHQSIGQDEAVGQNTSVVERPGAPIKGAIDAKVTVVEFLDPACGTCAQFYPLINQLLQRYEGKLRVMVRYAPLHPGSDQVVKMLEAAGRQGKFWNALELLFGNQRRWVVSHQAQPQRARGILNSIAMDQAQFDSDMHSAEVTGAVEQDVRDGQALGVRATPEFFVNGKPLPSFGYEQLERLVSDAVAANY
jgi:protein-disulfide isomerase